MNHKAYEGSYHGERAVWLQHGPYEAAILPEIGGNPSLLGITKAVTGSFANRKQTKWKHSNPIRAYTAFLFSPPNRYEDGRFPWNGQTYQFPINEDGQSPPVLHTIPWSVEDLAAASLKVTWWFRSPLMRIIRCMRCSAPVHFRLRYTLNQDGLASMCLYVIRVPAACRAC